MRSSISMLRKHSSYGGSSPKCTYGLGTLYGTEFDPELGHKVKIQRNFEPMQRQVEQWRQAQITDDRPS
jgi:hypothetical protein